MVLRCRSHIVAAESSPPPAESNHLRTAKSPRNGLRTSEKETTPAVLALTAMAMVEAVASEKLGGAGSRRRRRTTAARADTAAPSPSFHADLAEIWEGSLPAGSRMRRQWEVEPCAWRCSRTGGCVRTEVVFGGVVDRR
ncbi:Os03g0356512 [Oryza sativa Japonica Group]|uniref:Os03g0356512 protein n=1 Tax=Oryza sativa subsp. japonica TaxID=39947 RepID=A0A0P0VXM2_ORYSJ|nr:Os03g0356512 [Oryza sativa Japonica Group]